MYAHGKHIKRDQCEVPLDRSQIMVTLTKLLNDRKLTDVVSGILHWPVCSFNSARS